MISYNDNDVVRSEGEVAETLAVFDADYVFGLIENHIARRYEKHFAIIPNIVNSFKMIYEFNFHQMQKILILKKIRYMMKLFVQYVKNVIYLLMLNKLQKINI